MLKIDFGCGKKQKKGYVGCDVRKTSNYVKYVCNAWDIRKHVEVNSVECIYSRHMLEHLTFLQAWKTLEAWHDILVPGGSVNLIVPDMFWHCEQFVKNTRYREERQWPQMGFYGWQRETSESDSFTAMESLWDVHKSGYDEETLRSLVECIGFVAFCRRGGISKHLDVLFFNPFPGLNDA